MNRHKLPHALVALALLALSVIARPTIARSQEDEAWEEIERLERADIEAIDSLAWSSNNLLAVGTRDGPIHIWDATRGEHVATLDRDLRAPGETLPALAWSPDAARLAAGGERVTVWAIAQDGSMVADEPLIDLDCVGSVPSLAWSPDGAKLAGAQWRGTCGIYFFYSSLVVIWDTETGERLARLWFDPPSSFGSVAWSADGAHLAAGDAGGMVHIWDTDNWTEIASVEHTAGGVNMLVWSPDSAYLAAGSVYGYPVFPAEGYRYEGRDVALRGQMNRSRAIPDNTSQDRSSVIRVWDTSTWEVAAELEGHSSNGSAMAWSPDSTRLVSGGSSEGNYTLRVWDTSTWTEAAVVTLEGAGWGAPLVWSPDSAQVALGDADGTVRIYAPRQPGRSE